MIERLILAVDNGGTKTRLAPGYDIDRQTRHFPTPQNYESAIKQIASVTRDLFNGRRPDAVGFSVAGAIDNGVIVKAGKLHENGWVGKPFAEDISQELNVPLSQIVLLNDCAAGARAERQVTKPKPGQAGVYMVLSTGFGGAVYTDNQLIPDEPGHEYLREGAVCGCGGVGHMEAHISGSGIEKKFGIKGENLPHTDARWDEVRADLSASMDLTLQRYNETYGLSDIRTIGFAGSVALGGPDLIGFMHTDLQSRLGRQAPIVQEALFGSDSELYGAFFAAEELLQAA